MHHRAVPAVARVREREQVTNTIYDSNENPAAFRCGTFSGRRWTVLTGSVEVAGVPPPFRRRARLRERRYPRPGRRTSRVAGDTLIVSMAEEPKRGPPVVEIVLPTYITKPAEDEKFYPSEAKAVAEKVSKSWSLLCILVGGNGSFLCSSVYRN